MSFLCASPIDPSGYEFGTKRVYKHGEKAQKGFTEGSSTNLLIIQSMSNPDLAFAESVPTTNELYFTLVYVLILIYCCFGLAVICDVYFVPALQKLSYTYNLPPDIAGSTLMALGASVPELFASLIGVFITEDDIGTGSIIGSSCFNLIAVPAACAFVASASFSQELIVKPMPVNRNSAFYAITILVLILIIKDNEVDIPESLILMLFFIMYMAFMIVSARLNRNRLVEAEKSEALTGKGFSDQNSLTNSFSSADSAIAECGLAQVAKISREQRDNQPKANKYQSLINLMPSDGSALADTAETGSLQQAFGKVIYFDATSTPTTRSNYNVPASETQPLMTAPSLHRQMSPNNGDQSSKKPLFNYYSYNTYDCNPTRDYTHESTMYRSYEPIEISVSFDSAGVVMKNSTSLSMNKGRFSRSYNQQQQETYQLHQHQGNQYTKQHEHQSDCRDVDVSHSKGKSFEEESDWVSSIWVLVPMFPLTLSMKVLMPCKFKTTCCTIWTFFMSIALIGGLTYVSVWMVHMIGSDLGIPDTVAGMTILSWGTGIPELIASIVLIRKTAEADMAICNTIGSNVIDVSFCLSLPWLIKCLINKSQGLDPVVTIHSAALPWTSFLLVISVIALVVILALHNWTLNFSVGFWLSLVYVTFVLSAIFLEYKYCNSGLDLMALF